MDDPDSFQFILSFLIQAHDATLLDGSLDTVDLVLQFFFIVVGLIFSALFSGSEVAFFSLSNQQDVLTEGGISGSADELILKMLERPRRLLATILIGNTFANIITSVLAAVATGNIVAYFGFSEIFVYTLEVLVLTFMILILSEITPKIIAINDPLKSARKISRFIYGLYIILLPLSKLIANSTISLEERLPKPDSKMTSEDIMTMAEVSEMEGSIKSDEREIIENVIEFGTTSVREIMTSRVNVVAVSTENSLNEVLALIREKGLSRMPLYENDLDNILGIIYSKDVLPYINSDIERTTINWRTIARKALFIPATKKLDDLLRDFQQEKTHIAIVVDEYGGTEGLITLDDILEEIVGDISDEYGENEEQLYTQFKNGVYVFDAKIDLDDMEEILEIELTADDDDFETLGGLVYHLTERIPNVGERVYYKGLELTIHSVQNNRVRKLRVKLNEDDAKQQKSPVKDKE
ncbi:HlyC/CorC family transporter [Balneolaceae bacterium YR4-1]|uniref:HlyC/CorC family transporter n=1 Tax=Halalkalibaculum roseum TaxID=2709311 RepID=A0A6M1SVK4_9BACT|nr:hemolysin family protein [Halalkalibaculum roseum]NGP76128.1 HlyC/CorC family transporter [Halalkalibaculum roseum]